jgi:hypothetical protein
MGRGGAGETLKEVQQEPVEQAIPIPIPLTLIYLLNLLAKILNENLILAHQVEQHYTFGWIWK